MNPYCLQFSSITLSCLFASFSLKKRPYVFFVEFLMSSFFIIFFHFFFLIFPIYVISLLISIYLYFLTSLFISLHFLTILYSLLLTHHFNCLSKYPGMMIEEPFQRALKLEVFANTIRRDLSDLLHISDISPIQLNITSEALGEEREEDCASSLESLNFCLHTIDNSFYSICYETTLYYYFDLLSLPCNYRKEFICTSFCLSSVSSLI